MGLTRCYKTTVFYIYSYNTRVRENLHLDSVSKNYGKRTVKYKASILWNQLPSSLEEFSSVKCFSNKLMKFLQTADMDTLDSIFNSISFYLEVMCV